jgi:hypothetical protein
MTQARLDHVSPLRPIIPLHKSLIQMGTCMSWNLRDSDLAHHALSIDRITGNEGSLMIHAFDQLRP